MRKINLLVAALVALVSIVLLSGCNPSVAKVKFFSDKKVSNSEAVQIIEQVGINKGKLNIIDCEGLFIIDEVEYLKWNRLEKNRHIAGYAIVKYLNLRSSKDVQRANVYFQAIMEKPLNGKDDYKVTNFEIIVAMRSGEQDKYLIENLKNAVSNSRQAAKKNGAD